MNNQILAKLKELQKARGDTNAFASHDEFLPWSDNVAALLTFDEKLLTKFNYHVKHIKTSIRHGFEHRESLGEAIGILNQAILKLETIPIQKTINKKEIEYPKEITAKWLFQYVPVSFWVAFIGLLITVFAIGVGFSETQLYKMLKDNVVNSSETNEKHNK